MVNQEIFQNFINADLIAKDLRSSWHLPSISVRFECPCIGRGCERDGKRIDNRMRRIISSGC